MLRKLDQAVLLKCQKLLLNMIMAIEHDLSDDQEKQQLQCLVDEGLLKDRRFKVLETPEG